MKLIFNVQLNTTLSDIKDQINEDLFMHLAPKYPKLTVFEFGTIKKGSPMIFDLGFPVCTTWVGQISEVISKDNYYLFEDVGLELPFGITYWKHRHIFEQINDHQTLIKDEIEYKSFGKIFEWLFYPLIYLSFFGRPQKYRSLFEG